MSGHLGPLAAALVDDQLVGAERERALRHVASCATCRFEVEQQRAVKARLDGLGEPMLPGSLFEKLSSMRVPPPSAPSGPVGPPADPSRPSAGAPVPLPFTVGSGLAPSPMRSVTRSRVRRVLVGATSLVLLGGGAAYAAGGSSDSSAPPVRPAVDVYTLQHGTTSGAVPLNDPAVTVVTVGLGR